LGTCHSRAVSDQQPAPQPLRISKNIVNLGIAIVPRLIVQLIQSFVVPLSSYNCSSPSSQICQPRYGSKFGKPLASFLVYSRSRETGNLRTDMFSHLKAPAYCTRPPGLPAIHSTQSQPCLEYAANREKRLKGVEVSTVMRRCEIATR
jgi:hypothetical protein